MPSEQRRLAETLRKEYSVRQICETLSFNKTTFYYQPKSDASEDVLRAEIQRLAAAYPTYGYRRITKLLATEGHIDENGMPKDIKSLTSIGYGLEESAIEATQKSTFYPAMQNNIPIQQKVEIPYSFLYESLKK